MLMNPKERLMATLNGREPDRVPVYTLIPYAMDNGKMVPGPFHGYKDLDGWRKQDSLYWELVQRMDEECDNFFIWRPECMIAQNIFISPSSLICTEKTEEGDKVKFRYKFEDVSKTLYKTEVYQKGCGHSWVTEHFCKSIEDAMFLLKSHYREVPCETDSLKFNMKQLGKRGIAWITIPSPIMAVCRLFNPQDFLFFSMLHQNEIEKLMQTAYERIKNNLIKLLDKGAGPMIRFGGAEHATTPMMSPADFDRLVVEYDKPLMDICHSYGCGVAVHCHGNISHAVKRFMEMGVDQIDPVEASPWGDISLEEIRGITKDQITLTGNIQFSEISTSTPEEIKARVREIISIAGPKRLIVSTTGTPPEKISRRQYDNYNAMIDAVMEYR